MTASLRDEDAMLVELAQAGCSDAFARLYTRHRAYIGAVVAGRVSHTETRRDVEQETFARAWSKIGDLRNPLAFRSWAAQIARRLVSDHHRHHARLVHVDFADDSMPDPVCDDWDADDWLALNELSDAVQSGLDELSTRDVTAITLSTNFGFGPAEIGDALGITPNNAKVVLHRARRRLSQQIADARIAAVA